jgi:hypothetical protein
MDLTEFVGKLPTIAEENPEDYYGDCGSYLLEDRIIYPSVWPHDPMITFEPEGERVSFGLYFERIPKEHFQRRLFAEVMKLIPEDGNGMEVKYEIYWPTSPDRKAETAEDLDSVDIFASRGEDLPQEFFSAHFTKPSNGRDCTLGINVTGSYETKIPTLVKELGISRSTERFSRGDFAKNYGSIHEQALRDMSYLLGILNQHSSDQTVSIAGERTTTASELGLQHVPQDSKFYSIKISDRRNSTEATVPVRNVPATISTGITIPLNSIYIRQELPHDGGKVDFEFNLDTRSPTLLQAQDYLCKNMGVSFREDDN